jgi:hypothetical protein
MIYLYIKTHNITGLKYLGKTVSKDPHKYIGSGKRWRNHLKIHGLDYKTDILLATTNVQEFKETGIFFSNIFKVVESDDWANLKTEEGDGGWSNSALESSKQPNIRSKAIETRKTRIADDDYSKRISEGMKKSAKVKNGTFKGKTHTEESLRKMRKERPNFSGSNNHRHGMRWVKNITTRHSFQIDKFANIPEGYILGRIVKSSKD